MDGLARMRPLHFLSLSLVLLLPLRMGAQEGCDQRKPAEMGPGYFALPLHHAVSLPLQDLPPQNWISKDREAYKTLILGSPFYVAEA